MAEGKGIEPSTFRWQSFQDSLSTMLATLQIGTPPRTRTPLVGFGDRYIAPECLWDIIYLYGGAYRNRTYSTREGLYGLAIRCITSLPTLLKWSEWRDSNSRPSGPKPDALPDCATLG